MLVGRACDQVNFGGRCLSSVDALIAHMRDGRIADGFITAIDACGQKLATHFPRTEVADNLLPDRIYQI